MTGRTLAHYRLLEKLGEGGMGAVYRAEDTRLGRAVAVKILSAEKVADPHYLARFLQEARLASSLNHPNIATIHNVGEADGLHYIAMELVEGESLRRRASGQPLKLGLLLDLALHTPSLGATFPRMAGWCLEGKRARRECWIRRPARRRIWRRCAPTGAIGNCAGRATDACWRIACRRGGRAIRKPARGSMTSATRPGRCSRGGCYGRNGPTPGNCWWPRDEPI